MADYYRNICELTLKYRDSKEVVVRKGVITLIPNMVAYDSSEFEKHYLHRSMSYLQSALHRPSDRDIGWFNPIVVGEAHISLHRHRSHVGSAAIVNASVYR